MARIFFLFPQNISDKEISFSGEDIRHLISLRVQSGDTIHCILLNNEEVPYAKADVMIRKTPKGFSGIMQTQEPIVPRDLTHIHVMQCIPKLDKMDSIIQKCAELDAYEVIPMFSRYTDIKGHIGEQKQIRWKRIAQESSIQSGRETVMRIHEPIDMWNFLSISNISNSVKIILNELEETTYIQDIAHLFNADTQDIYVLIGAEGGFHPDEIAKLRNEYGFQSVKLKGNILRTETAGPTMTAIIQYILGNL